MTTMFLRHKVSDYSKWKSVYDSFGPTRKEKGVIAASVHREASDPNTVIVTHQFKDMSAATALVNSEELKSAMQNAGVISQPEIWFTEDVESTLY